VRRNKERDRRMCPPIAKTIETHHDRASCKYGPSCEPEEALDRVIIAELSSRQLARMTRGELARVVRASPPPGKLARIEYLDDGTLQRLAHLARLSCCNRG